VLISNANFCILNLLQRMLRICLVMPMTSALCQVMKVESVLMPIWFVALLCLKPAFSFCKQCFKKYSTKCLRPDT